MKIEQSRIDPLLQQEQAQKARGERTGEGFGEVMAREAARGDASRAGMPLPPPGVAAGFDPRFAASDVMAAALLHEGAEEAASGLEGLLDELAAYARELDGRGDSHLRGAYGRLESIESRLNALKADPAAGQALALNQNLAGILNELEVLAATEKFKFNRGDYL